MFPWWGFHLGRYFSETCKAQRIHLCQQYLLFWFDLLIHHTYTYRGIRLYEDNQKLAQCFFWVAGILGILITTKSLAVEFLNSCYFDSKPSLKIRIANAICWNSLGLFSDYDLNYIFLGIKLFLFFKIESWNFQHLCKRISWNLTKFQLNQTTDRKKWK